MHTLENMFSLGVHKYGLKLPCARALQEISHVRNVQTWGLNWLPCSTDSFGKCRP